MLFPYDNHHDEVKLPKGLHANHEAITCYGIYGEKIKSKDNFWGITAKL